MDCLEQKFLAALTDPSKKKMLTENVGLFAATIRRAMVKYEGLTKREADEVSIILNNEDQFQQIIKKVIEKNEMSCYVAFSRALYLKNEYIWSTVFPFATEYDHLKLPPKQKTVPKQPQAVAIDHPDVMWICENEDIFKIACDELKIPEGWNTKSTSIFKYYDASRYPHHNVKIWVFYPTSNNLDVLNLLTYFNKTRYCIFTGTGTSVNKPFVRNGDICVASSEYNNSLLPQICYTTREMEQCNEGVAWRCGRGPSVVFGSIRASAHSSGIGVHAKPDVMSKSGSDFYSHAEKMRPSIPHVAILAVSDDKSDCSCGFFYYQHAVTYSHSIILDICEKIMLLDSCRGRQPI